MSLAPPGVRNIVDVIEGRTALPERDDFISHLGLPAIDPWDHQDNRDVISTLSRDGWTFEQVEHRPTRRRWRVLCKRVSNERLIMTLTADEIDPSVFRLEASLLPPHAARWEHVLEASTVTGDSRPASGMAALRADERISSAVTVISREGVVLEQAQFGRENLTAGALTSEVTQFRWGSVTKVLTALSVLRLVNERSLSLATPVNVILPHLRWASPLSSEVQVRHLLTHTAGLARTTSLESELTLQFRPGTLRSYSNTGFNLLAMIVATVAGEQFTSWVQREMFNRLGMINARIEAYASDLRGYDRGFGLLWPARQPRLDEGARGLTASCADISKLAAEVLNCREMFVGQTIGGVVRHDRGLGLLLTRLEGRRAGFHDGGVANSWQTFFCVEPQSGLAVVSAADSHPVGLEVLAEGLLAQCLRSPGMVNLGL